MVLFAPHSAQNFLDMGEMSGEAIFSGEGGGVTSLWDSVLPFEKKLTAATMSPITTMPPMMYEPI